MIEKIKEKGFKYNVAEDFFVGFYYGMLLKHAAYGRCITMQWVARSYHMYALTVPMHV